MPYSVILSSKDLLAMPSALEHQQASPQARWSDDLYKAAGKSWMREPENRTKWDAQVASQV